jgi:hypothetical protein
MKNRKEERSAPVQGGLTHDRKICWDGRAFDVAGARRWMVQQLAKEVVKRLREQDDDEHKS